MNREMLAEFCANEQEPRHSLRAPWREDDGRVVASDGRIMIVLDALPGDFPAPSPSIAHSTAAIATACDKQWVDGWRQTWIRVSDLEIPENAPCAWCDMEEKPGCYRCYWTGIETVAMRVGEQSFQVRYMNLLKRLPDCEIAVPSDGYVARFRFAGGVGYLAKMIA